MAWNDPRVKTRKRRRNPSLRSHRRCIMFAFNNVKRINSKKRIRILITSRSVPRTSWFSTDISRFVWTGQTSYWSDVWRLGMKPFWFSGSSVSTGHLAQESLLDKVATRNLSNLLYRLLWRALNRFLKYVFTQPRSSLDYRKQQLLDNMAERGHLNCLSLKNAFQRDEIHFLKASAEGPEPEGSVRGERANFTRLVLGCIEAKLCK